MKINSYVSLPENEKIPYTSRSHPDIACSLAILKHENLLATHSKTFSFAARFFPTELRQAVVSLYAFFRTLDDLVDERGESWCRDDVVQELDAWSHWFANGTASPTPHEPLGAIIAMLLERYQIPVVLFKNFLDGLRTDLEPVEMHDFDELYQYCYRVAGTVGVVMTYVLGVRSRQTHWAAKQLGIAMQLTNILRDLGRDLSVGRIYLPRMELAQFGSSPEHLLQLYQTQKGPDERFCALIRYQIQRARFYYQAGLHGVWLIDSSCRLPIVLAGRLYQRILTEIELRQYDVLRRRAATTMFTKLREAGIVMLLDLLWGRGEMKASLEQEHFYED
jgi:phytoene synthase